MATTTWNSSGDTDWGTAGNWDTAAVPGTGDDVMFDATSVVNCVLDQSRACRSLEVNGGYTGDIDLATFDLTVDDGGNVTLDGTGTFDMGTGTLSLTNGDFDNKDQGTFDDGSSTLSMAGTGDIISASGRSLCHLTIEEDANITIDTYLLSQYGTIEVKGSLTKNAVSRFYCYHPTLILRSTGTITGTGYLYMYQFEGAEGFTIFEPGGIFDVATFDYIRPYSGVPLPAGTYGSTNTTVVNNTGVIYTLALDGTYIFTGNFTIENSNAAGSFIMANDTNDPDITFQGDVTVDEQAGTITWNKGLGTNTFSGASDQDVDFNGLAVEDIVIDKSAGNIVLTGDVTTDSFTGTDTGTGDFDANGKTLTTTGNCSLASGFDIDSAADAMNGCTLDIGGDFTANGQTLNATASWDLQVDGTATALGTGAVAYSDASGYASVAAWSGPWTTNGNNLNWEFSILTTATGTITLTREISTISLTPTPRDIDLSLVRRTLTLE